jgi:hypothetical protein
LMIKAVVKPKYHKGTDSNHIYSDDEITSLRNYRRAKGLCFKCRGAGRYLLAEKLNTASYQQLPLIESEAGSEERLLKHMQLRC